MSVVVGENNHMATRYRDICEEYDCKAKVFTQMLSDFQNKPGTPDLKVVFTNTCSHKMASRVNQKSVKHDISVVRIHGASASTLKNSLAE